MPRTIEVEEQDAALLCEAARKLVRHSNLVERLYGGDELLDAAERVEAALACKTMGDPDDG